MKEELRSESQAKSGGAGLPAVLSVVAAAAKGDAAKVGKSGKAHFSARLVFLPSPSMSVHESPCQSSPVKVDQTGLIGQAGASNLCKYFKVNRLHNKQLLSGQTSLNLVKHDQN
jgi:hypothetical protein